MTERTINFGTDAADADFQIRDTSGTGGNLVIEHLPTGDTITYNATTNQWEAGATVVPATDATETLGTDGQSWGSVSAGGGSIAHSGTIRLPHGGTIKARNAADGNDIAAFDLGGTVTLANDEIGIGTLGNYANIILGNGDTGEIRADTDLVPRDDGTQALGSATKGWANSHFDGLTVNGQSGVEQPQDKTSSRSNDTWETNNTGNPLFVSVSGLIASGDTSADTVLQVNFHVNSSQTNQSVNTDMTQTSDGNQAVIVGVSGIVPDGAEYKARLGYDTTNASIDSWFESKVGV